MALFAALLLKWEFLANFASCTESVDSGCYSVPIECVENTRVFGI